MAEKSSYIPGTASWVDLMTPDLEGAKKFYAGIFDWSYDDGGPQMGHYTRCMMRSKMVAGVMAQSGDMLAHPSVWNVYFDTTNLAKTLAAVTEASGKIFMPAQEVMDLGIMAFCVDPTGGAFGLWQAGTHKGAQLFGEPGAMAWHEFRTRDLKTALSFYEKVLGNPFEKMGGPMEYYTQKAEQKMHAGVMNMPDGFPASVPSHWTVYFAVKNADEASAKIKATGGKIISEPFDTPYGRNGYASDPFGAPFAFIQMNG